MYKEDACTFVCVSMIIYICVFSDLLIVRPSMMQLAARRRASRVHYRIAGIFKCARTRLSRHTHFLLVLRSVSAPSSIFALIFPPPARQSRQKSVMMMAVHRHAATMMRGMLCASSPSASVATFSATFMSAATGEEVAPSPRTGQAAELVSRRLLRVVEASGPKTSEELWATVKQVRLLSFWRGTNGYGWTSVCFTQGP